MAKMIINGEVCSGSNSYASAVEYIKEDGSKSTVQDELSELNKKFEDLVIQLGGKIETDSGSFSYEAQPSCSISVTFGRPFLRIPNVQATVLDGKIKGTTTVVPSQYLTATVSSVTQSGCVITVTQSYTGSAVVGAVSWSAEASILS